MKNLKSIESALEKTTDTKALIIDVGAMKRTPEMFSQLFPGRTAVIVADQNTWDIAAEEVAGYMKQAGIPMVEPFIFQDRNIFAEWSFVEDLEAALGQSDAIPVAVGAGVVNDLTKLVSEHLGRRYMIVATTVSMDGFSAYGASVIKDGFKRTFDCRAAYGIIVDPAVAAKAPKYLAVSGYADLLAKIPAGADWIVADAMGCENLDEFAWHLVQDGLRDSLSAPEAVYNGEVPAIKSLAQELILSGFAMQSCQSSRPASGTEHLFGHYWEMTDLSYTGKEEVPGFETGKSFLSEGRRVPHGFAVGIGSLVSAACYEFLLSRDLSAIDIDACVNAWPSWENMEAEIRRVFVDIPQDQTEITVKDCRAKYPSKEQLRSQLGRVRDGWPALKARLESELMTLSELRGLLKTVHAPYEPEMIAVSRACLRTAFRHIPYMRDRITAIDLIQRLGLLPELETHLFGPGGYWDILN